LNLSEELEEVDYKAFFGCSGLTGDLNLQSVKKIGSYAFHGCSGFEGALNLSEELEEVGAEAFYGCSGLTGELLLHDSLREVPSDAFNGCSNLTGLRLLSSYCTVDSNAFTDCSNLNAVTIAPFTTFRFANAFDGCPALAHNFVKDHMNRLGRWKNHSAFMMSLNFVDNHFRALAKNRGEPDELMPYRKYVSNNGASPLMVTAAQSAYLERFDSPASTLLFLCCLFVDGSGFDNGILRLVAMFCCEKDVREWENFEEQFEDESDYDY
jgi:hypothetical protein